MEINEISIDKIRPSPYQPRETFDKEKIQELAESIKSVGILEPIIVRQNGDTYQIIAGERRWRAAQFAGLKKIPAIIKDITGEHMLEESLVENWHRTDLSHAEKENAVYALWKSGKYTSHTELAKKLGTSGSTVSDNIKAKEAREKIDKIIGKETTVATRAIIDTEGIDDESRSKIIKNVEDDNLQAQKIRQYVSVLKQNPSKAVKEALLKPDSKVTPEKAMIIEKELSDDFDKAKMVEMVEKHGLDEDSTKIWVQEIKEEGVRAFQPKIVAGKGLNLKMVERLSELGRLGRDIQSFYENTKEHLDVEDLTRLHQGIEVTFDRIMPIYNEVSKMLGKKEVQYIKEIDLRR